MTEGEGARLKGREVAGAKLPGRPARSFQDPSAPSTGPQSSPLGRGSSHLRPMGPLCSRPPAAREGLPLLGWALRSVPAAQRAPAGHSQAPRSAGGPERAPSSLEVDLTESWLCQPPVRCRQRSSSFLFAFHLLFIHVRCGAMNRKFSIYLQLAASPTTPYCIILFGVTF